MRKVFMAMSTIMFFAVWIGMGLWLDSYEYHWAWCTIWGLVVACCVDSVISIFIMPIVKYLPITMQKPFYLAWKENLLKINGKADPLISYPMAAFIELELDKYFEESGLISAEEALFNRFNNLSETLLKQEKK